MKKEFWDNWRGSSEGDVVMLTHRFLSLGGWNIDLHCFVGCDMEGCFHTHPSWAFRLVLWGGYIEELETGERKLWMPFRFGFVGPKYSHRVATPIYRKSYSLWIRSPKKHEVELRGDGWSKLAEIKKNEKIKTGINGAF